MRHPTYTKDKPEKENWDDRLYQCCRCHNWMLIPHCHVGGAWHLSGWADSQGNKHFGMHCSPCFNELHDLPEVAK